MAEPATEFVPPKISKPSGITPTQVEHKEPPAEILKMEFKVDPLITKDHDPSRILIEDQSGATKEAKISKENDERISTTGSVTEPTKTGDTKGGEQSKEVDATVELKHGEAKQDSGKEGISKFLKAPEDKKDETVKPKIDEKSHVVQQVKVPVEKKLRNYDGYSQEQIGHFKQMSDDAYQYVSKLITENKDLSKAKDGTFLQHPEAYTLSPQFKQLQNGISMAQKEADVWSKTLVECKEGKPFKPLEAWDKNGNPVYGNEVQPTAEVEERIRMAMNHCYQVVQQKQGELNGIVGNFKQQVDGDLRNIQQERANRFEWVANPKLQDYTLNVGGVDKSIKQIRNEIISVFPNYLHSNPATEVCGDLVVALVLAQMELQEARNGQKVAEIKKDEAIRQEPSSDIKPAAEKGPVIGKVREFNLAGIPR